MSNAICLSCHSYGRPLVTGPSSTTQMILAFLTTVAFVFLFPVGLVLLIGLVIYSLRSKKTVCVMCGGQVIPADSQRGKEMLAARGVS